MQIALSLFYQLTENVSEFLKPHFGTLHGVLLNSLRDAEPRVRIAALKGFCSFISSLTAEQMVHILTPVLHPHRHTCTVTRTSVRALNLHGSKTECGDIRRDIPSCPRGGRLTPTHRRCSPMRWSRCWRW